VSERIILFSQTTSMQYISSKYVPYLKALFPLLTLKASSVLSIQVLVMLLKFGLLLPTYNRICSEYLSSAAYGNFAITIGSSIVLCGRTVLVGLSTVSACLPR
jgi:hypothetical protein